VLALRSHLLVRADLREAFDWYEDQQAGLGLEFAADFRKCFRRLRAGPQLCAIRFADVRRMNLERFPYAIFYIIHPGELRLLAVLHASRDSSPVLAERRRTFSTENR
jgi:plasmid stabilization system protein ParE